MWNDKRTDCDLNGNKSVKLKGVTAISVDSVFSSKDPIIDKIALSSEKPPKNYDYEPYSHRDLAHPNTDFEALAHLLKCSMGTGILAMPSGIRSGGLLFGLFGTIFIGYMCTHCVQILVRSSYYLCKKHQKPSMDIAETAEAAFIYGPPFLRKYSTFAKYFVFIAIVLTYFSASSVYIVLVSEAFYTVFNQLQTTVYLSQVNFMFILLIFLLPTNQIRKLKFLAPFSATANLLIVTAMGITLYYVFSVQQTFDNRKLYPQFSDLPTYFSTIVFAIEGIGAVMPVENNMANPSHLLGCPGILNIGMFTVIAIYSVIGFFGYLRFGADTESNIVMSLPSTALGSTGKVLIGFAMLFTYPLQFFVAMDIFWKVLNERCRFRRPNVAQIVLRIVIVCITVIIAAVVKRLGAFIGLVGAIFLSLMGIFLPAFVETMTRYDHLGRFYWRLIKNVLIMAFSLFTLVTGCYVSMREIVAR